MQKKLQKQQAPNKKLGIFWRILLPPFDELQFILLLFIFLVAPVNGNPLIVSFVEIVLEALFAGYWVPTVLTFVLLLISFIPLLIIFRRTKLAHDMKLEMSVMFYAALTYLAISSILTYSEVAIDSLSFLETFNFYLIILLFVIALIRILIILVSAEVDSIPLQKLVTGSFSDQQMRAWQFFLSIALAAGIMGWSYGQGYATTHAQMVILTYVYSYAIYKLIEVTISHANLHDKKRVKPGN